MTLDKLKKDYQKKIEYYDMLIKENITSLQKLRKHYGPLTDKYFKESDEVRNSLGSNREKRQVIVQFLSDLESLEL